MRFMIIVKANKNSEAGVMPSQELLTEMGKFNEALLAAGVMLAGEGLHPSSKGADGTACARRMARQDHACRLGRQHVQTSVYETREAAATVGLPLG